MKNGFAKDAVFVSILREPVSRVFSLYNYYRSRGELPGMNNDLSISRSILENEHFRNKIRNAQNKYISGRESFNYTKSFIENNSFLIGTQDDVQQFQDVLAYNLGFNVNKKVSGNVGDSGYKKNLSLSLDAQRELENLIFEDVQLFNFLRTKCSGLINTVPEAAWEDLRLSVSHFLPSKNLFLGRAELKEQVLSKKSGERFKVSVKIENFSGTNWLDDDDSRLFLSYHWLKSDYTEYNFPGIRTPINRDVQDGEVILSSMDVLAPDEPGTYILEATGVKARCAWFENDGFRVDRMVCKVV
ncbi:hypothetical protein [Marinobacter metalliresistant]|uniref:Sulfotransferase family protein n=1 Tax=Marinobacter metalliresistant TaxID=2961995 RepID=A0ABZ2W530_9GAMM